MDHRTNLLQETISNITEHDRSVDDVQYVSRSTSGWDDIEPEWCTWEEFASRADFEYYAGYGGEEINTSLKVVGSNWWLERHEYDGSEWWEFKTMPMKPSLHVPDFNLRRRE